jgi:hypothetical protein
MAYIFVGHFFANFLKVQTNVLNLHV